MLSSVWSSQPSNCVGCFLFISSTAAMTLGAAGSSLDFYSAKSYNGTIRVNYAGLFDTATVTIWIREVNKPATWTGLYIAVTLRLIV